MKMVSGTGERDREEEQESEVLTGDEGAELVKALESLKVSDVALSAAKGGEC